MKTKHIIVSAIATLSIIACGGMKVDLAPSANAAEEQKPGVDAGAAVQCECSGEPGAEGPMGPEGKQGPAGEQGLQGPRGLQGDQGQPGGSGPQGADGAMGPAGAVGPQGPRGNDGAPGARGAAGPQGEQGEQGIQGPAISPSLVYVRESASTFDNTQSGEILRRGICEHEGDVVLSGGCRVIIDNADASTRLVANTPSSDAAGWDCSMRKAVGTTVTFVVRVMCISAQ